MKGLWELSSQVGVMLPLFFVSSVIFPFIFILVIYLSLSHKAGSNFVFKTKSK